MNFLGKTIFQGLKSTFFRKGAFHFFWLPRISLSHLQVPPPRWRMTAFVPQKIQKFKTFPTSLETDMPSNSWEMKWWCSFAKNPGFHPSCASFHKFVVKLSGSELDTIMAGDPLFQVCEAYISPNHPSTTRHIVTVVHRIGLPFTWETHHCLGTNFGKLLVRKGGKWNLKVTHLEKEIIFQTSVFKLPYSFSEV